MQEWQLIMRELLRNPTAILIFAVILMVFFVGFLIFDPFASRRHRHHGHRSGGRRRSLRQRIALPFVRMREVWKALHDYARRRARRRAEPSGWPSRCGVSQGSRGPVPGAWRTDDLLETFVAIPLSGIGTFVGLAIFGKGGEPELLPQARAAQRTLVSGWAALGGAGAVGARLSSVQ